MGRVAGAPGGRRLTDWAFALDDAPCGGAGPLVLILSPADIARLPGPPGEGRRATRERVLAALVSRVLPADPPPRLVAAADGVRCLAGSAWFASVAERDGWGAAALARHPVGVDLEAVAEAIDADAILAGIAAVDRAAWLGLAGIWAAREAVLKAVGRDLTRDPGGWRFGRGRVAAAGIAPHRVETVARDGIVAALAYVGS